MNKLMFATKINGTEETGIVDIKSQQIFCLCTKEVADEILKAFSNESRPELYAIFDGGNQGMKDVGLMGIFDSVAKAKESIGERWIIIKKVTPNIIYENGIPYGF